MRSEHARSAFEWPAVPLKDLCVKIRSGATPKGGAESYLEKRSRFVLIRSQNVLNHCFVVEGLANISDAQAVELEGVAIQADDVLLNITGDGVTFGRSCLAPEHVLPAYVNQHVMLIRTDRKKCHPGYLSAWLGLNETKSYIESFNAGGSRRAITKRHIESFQVPLPPMQIQEEIARCLAILNNRIDLLRQTNTTLESIAQALFKSWFIDFDPVRAKAEGREPEGMDAATAALFPAGFEESAFGPIPEGWQTGTLADLALLNASSWTMRRAPQEMAYIDLAGVKANVFDPPQRYSFVQAPSRARRELRAGDTLIGTVRPGNRSFGFIAEAEPGLTGSTGFAVLSPKVPSAAALVYLCATRHENIDRLAALADGGAYPAVQPELVHRTTCVVPPMQILDAFHALAFPILCSIGSRTAQTRVLNTLRDSLLPHLISGKLRLPEVREQIEEALA